MNGNRKSVLLNSWEEWTLVPCLNSDLHYMKKNDTLKVRCLVTRMLYNEMHNHGFHQKFIQSIHVIQLPPQSLRQSWGRKWHEQVWTREKDLQNIFSLRHWGVSSAEAPSQPLFSAEWHRLALRTGVRSYIIYRIKMLWLYLQRCWLKGMTSV